MIPSKPINQQIWLRNVSKYVSSNNGVGAMTTNKVSIGTWERFTVVDAGDNKVALRGNNNRFVNSQNGAARMTCNSTSIGGWEAFEWIDIDGKVALKGFNGKFVSSEGGSNAGMNSNRETVSAWEAFNWATTNGSTAKFGNEIKDDNVNDISDAFLLYPNPAFDEISFNLELQFKNHSVLIYDTTGKLIFEKKYSTENNLISVSHFPLGTYFLTVVSENKKFNVTKQFVKK